VKTADVAVAEQVETTQDATRTLDRVAREFLEWGKREVKNRDKVEELLKLRARLADNDVAVA
jgi:hypothetical protein